jgi:hypothetical protein
MFNTASVSSILIGYNRKHTPVNITKRKLQVLLSPLSKKTSFFYKAFLQNNRFYLINYKSIGFIQVFSSKYYQNNSFNQGNFTQTMVLSLSRLMHNYTGV